MIKCLEYLQSICAIYQHFQISNFFFYQTAYLKFIKGFKLVKSLFTFNIYLKFEKSCVVSAEVDLDVFIRIREHPESVSF